MVEAGESPVMSALDRKIVKQIEYYFGDMNLPRDTFLREEIKKEDGWVSLEILVTFNRLKQLTTDHNVITSALKASGTTFIQVSEDNVKIRRNPDLPVPEVNKERTEDIRKRTYYVKGFPLDVSLDALMEFFEKFGKVDQIQMRKDMKRNFKGSIFIVFNSKEDGEKFLNTETVEYSGTELKKETRDGYFSRKEAEKKSKKEEDLQRKLEIKKQKDEEDSKKLSDCMTKGAVLCLKNVVKDTTREQIKESFMEYLPVAYIEFSIGDTEAKVRFETEGAASIAVEKMKENNDGKISINGTEVEYRVLDGDEEVDYWKKYIQEQKDRKSFKRKGGAGRGRKRFGGGGRFDSQRRQPRNENSKTRGESEPAEKKAKTEVEATS